MSGVSFETDTNPADDPGQVVATIDYTGASTPDFSGSGDWFFCPAADGWSSSCHSTGPGAFVWGDQAGLIPANWFNPGDLIEAHIALNEGGSFVIGEGVWPGAAPPSDPVPISDWSNTVQGFAGIAPTLPPVTNLTLITDPDTWHLAWDRFDGADFYLLQFKHEPGGAWTELATPAQTVDARQTFDLQFSTDERFTELDEYSFRVRAMQTGA